MWSAYSRGKNEHEQRWAIQSGQKTSVLYAQSINHAGETEVKGFIYFSRQSLWTSQTSVVLYFLAANGEMMKEWKKDMDLRLDHTCLPEVERHEKKNLIFRFPGLTEDGDEENDGIDDDHADADSLGIQESRFQAHERSVVQKGDVQRVPLGISRRIHTGHLVHRRSHACLWELKFYIIHCTFKILKFLMGSNGRHVQSEA